MLSAVGSNPSASSILEGDWDVDRRMALPHYDILALHGFAEDYWTGTGFWSYIWLHKKHCSSHDPFGSHICSWINWIC